MIKLGNFTILLDEKDGKFYIPEMQGICSTLKDSLKYVEKIILENKQTYSKEEL